MDQAASPHPAVAPAAGGASQVPRPPTRASRVPFTIIDEGIHHLDRPAEPWTVHVEVRAEGRLDEARLRVAIGEAVRRHPMARARRAPWCGWQRQLVWEIREGTDVDPLCVVDGGTREAVRDELCSRAVPLDVSPPFRLSLVRHPGGDVLLLSVHHSAADGLGSLRLLVSIVRAYAGVADPLPEVDPLVARGLDGVLPADGLAARLWRVAALLGELRRARARMATEGAAERPGFGFHTLRLTALETAALGASRRRGATVNDFLLAALHLAIAQWNAEHGAPAAPIAVMTPINLRPAAWRHDVVGNLSSFVTIWTGPAERTTPIGTLAAVTVQTRRMKAGPAAAAPLEALAASPLHPLWAKQALWALLPLAGDRLVDTAVLSNLGRLDGLLSFGPDTAPAAELWFSPPCRMPLGLAVGAVTFGGRLHLTFRYRHALLGPEAAARFAARYVEALRALA